MSGFKRSVMAALLAFVCALGSTLAQAQTYPRRPVHVIDTAGVTDLLTGEVSLMFNTLASISQHIKAGKVRVLAVAGSQPAVIQAETPKWETMVRESGARVD